MAEGRIGVVTVTYNSGEVLPDFLRCLLNQTYSNFLLLAIDNASKDNTLEILKTWTDDRLSVIANTENLGVAEGNNQGIRRALEAGCTSVLLLNNDTEFGETLLEELAAGLDLYQCDMICPKIMFHDQPNRIWAAGGYFQPRLGYRALHYGKGEVDRGQFDEVRQITYTPTCCVLIRSELFASIGLMDARYFAYVDDTDFMYRALRVGKRLFYLPKVKLLHKIGSLTGGSESPFSIRFGARNHAFFALKHFGRFQGTLITLVHRAYYLAGMLAAKDTYTTFKLKQAAVGEAFRMLRQAD